MIIKSQKSKSKVFSVVAQILQPNANEKLLYAKK